MGDKSLDMFLKEMNDRKVSEAKARDLITVGWLRKGVLLGIGQNIFDQKIEQGKDAPGEEVCIHLPNGLDQKYINGIHPIGVTERHLLTE